MTVKLVVFSARRSDFSPDQYKEYYENSHVPLIRELLGDAFPVVYIRNYISRSPDASQNYPVELLMGQQENIDIDCIAESIFRDQAHLEQCMAELGNPEKKKAREEDEAKFLDVSKLRAFVVDANRAFPAGSSSYTATG